MPITVGTYSVVVTASDGINAASANFTWTVTPGAALTLAPLPPLPPVLAVTGVASYTASASGGINVIYRWDFGDGTPQVVSSAPTTTHTFASPGIYNVTVTANDDRGIPVTRTAVQTVYLPPAGVGRLPRPRWRSSRAPRGTRGCGS